MDKLEWKIRDGRDSDTPFIRGSWFRSSSGPHEEAQRLKWRIRCLTDTSVHAKTLVAVDKDDDDFIYGWICYSDYDDAVHYVYTRQSFRSVGVAKSLWLAAGNKNKHTGWTKAVENIKAVRRENGEQWGLLYAPSLLRNVDEAYKVKQSIDK